MAGLRLSMFKSLSKDNSSYVARSTFSHGMHGRHIRLTSPRCAYPAGSDHSPIQIAVMAKRAWQSTTHPYVKGVGVPAGCTILAWALLPAILRKLHDFAKPSEPKQTPYDSSLWSAPENPVKYLVSLFSITQIVLTVTPNDWAEPINRTCILAAIVLASWTFFKVKSIALGLLDFKVRKSKLDATEVKVWNNLSTIGWILITVIVVANAFGKSVKDTLEMGGAGGAVVAFALKDILGNVLNGLFMQLITKPFSIGDMIKTIKAESVEGQVEDIGYTSASFLSAEKFSMTIPYSMLSKQVIVNKSNDPVDAPPVDSEPSVPRAADGATTREASPGGDDATY